MAMLILFVFGVGVVLLIVSSGMHLDGQSRLIQALKNSGHYDQYASRLGPTNVLHTSRFTTETSPEAARAAQQLRAGIYIGMLALVLIVVPVMLPAQYSPSSDFPWNRPMNAGDIAGVMALLAFVGATASWLVGAVFFGLALRGFDRNRFSWFSVIAWPLALGRIKGAVGEPAANVNKALVALLACLMVAFAAFSVSTNLHRFAK